MEGTWTGPVVRAACGHDLAVTFARQMSYAGIWCGHRDVHGRLTPDRRVQPIDPAEAHKCECVRVH